MSMKIRVLYNSKKGKMQSFAQAIADKYQLTANSIDTIPPAYQCDNERIVIVGCSLGSDIPSAVSNFAREVTKQKAQNVALYIDGKESLAKELVAIFQKAGTNVIDEIHYVKCGLPIFKKISDEEQSAMLAWVERILKKLK